MIGNKTYELSDAQRAIVYEGLEQLFMNTINERYLAEVMTVADMFRTPHPIDPEIEGRPQIIAYLHERGFKGREVEAMMSYTWGPKAATWADIMTGLNMDNPAHHLMRLPNIGRLTVISIMKRCIAHGWIRDPFSRRMVDKFLGGQ